MQSPANDAPLVLVKWYAYAKWILERVSSSPVAGLKGAEIY